VIADEYDATIVTRKRGHAIVSARHDKSVAHAIAGS